MWPDVTSCDQLWPAVTSCQSTSKTVKKHVFGHISAQENALQAKMGQNDRKVSGFHQKKFGGDSWPNKIGRAVNIQNLPGAVASIPP